MHILYSFNNQEKKLIPSYQLFLQAAEYVKNTI